MPNVQRRVPSAAPPDEWTPVAAEGQELTNGVAASALEPLAFFAGWIGVGVLIGLRLAKHGHDRRLMVGLGVGLGPLMLLVASDAPSRRRETPPLVLAPGLDHGGDLDLVVVVPGSAEEVRSVVPTVEAVAEELGTLTLVCAVPYEWLDPDDLENEVVEAARSTLVAARNLVPVTRPALLIVPGNGQPARPVSSKRRTLVLTALGDAAALDPW